MTDAIKASDLLDQNIDKAIVLTDYEFFLSGGWRRIVALDVLRRFDSPLILCPDDWPDTDYWVDMDELIPIRPASRRA